MGGSLQANVGLSALGANVNLLESFYRFSFGVHFYKNKPFDLNLDCQSSSLPPIGTTNN